MRLLYKEQLEKLAGGEDVQSTIYGYEISNREETQLSSDNDFDFVLISDGKAQYRYRHIWGEYYKVNRIHHKVRIQKKWIKRYGYKYIEENHFHL